MPARLHSFYFPLRENVATDLQDLILDPGDGSPTYKKAVLAIFFLLQILGGHVGVPIILGTFVVVKSIRRHPLLINFLITWVLYATSFCLLLYLGKELGPEPPRDLCLFQASMIYGTAGMTSMAGLAFVLHLWFSLRSVDNHSSGAKYQTWRNTILIASPYACFVIFTVFTAILGAVHPEVVTRHRYFFYCTVHLSAVNVVPGTSAVILVFVVIFEILIAVRLYRMRKAFALMKTSGGPPIHLIIRVGIFSTYSFLAVFACIGFWSETGDDVPYIVQASLPTVAFVVFGTQRDLMTAWGFFRLWDWIMRRPRRLNTSKALPLAPPMANVVML